MAGWDEFLDAAGIAGRAGSRGKGKKGKVDTKPVKLAASGALVARAATPAPKGLVSQAWDGLWNNAASLYRPASTFGRQLADIGDEKRTTKFFKAIKDRSDDYHKNPAAYPQVHADPTDAAATAMLLNLPRIDESVAPVARAARNAWSRVFSGTNADDGDLGAILGERGAAKWAPIQESIDNVRRVKEGDTRSTVQKATEATMGPAAMFFDPNVAGVEDAAEDAGMGPLASTIFSLLVNPFEWPGAPSKASRAAIASAGKFGKARRLLNEAGALTDTLQTAMDYGAPLAKKAMNWRLPGKAVEAADGAAATRGATGDANFAERAGVDEAELQRRVAEIQEADAARFGSDADVAAAREFAGLNPDGSLDDVGEELGRVREFAGVDAGDAGDDVARAREFAGLRTGGSAPAALSDELDAVREFAGVQPSDAWREFEALGAVDNAADDVARVREFAGMPEDPDALARAREFAGIGDAPVARVADDAADIARARDFAGIPEDPDALLRAREFAGVADLAPAPRVADDVADIARAREFAGVEPAPLWDEFEASIARQVDTTPIPQGVIDEAIPATPATPAARAAQVDPGGTGIENGIGRGIDEGVAPVAPLPGIAGAESAADVAAPLVAAGRNDGLVKLNVSLNPVKMAWDAFTAVMRPINKAFDNVLFKPVAGAAKRFEGGVTSRVNARVKASDRLRPLDESFGRVFRENPGVIPSELLPAVHANRLATNEVLRTTRESILNAFDEATPQQREVIHAFMGGNASRQQLKDFGVSDNLIDTALRMRALTDIKADELIAESIRVDRAWLSSASVEGKRLIGELVQKNLKGVDSKQLEAARQAAGAKFAAEAETIIDATMSAMKADGLIDDAGNIVGMPLSIPTWIKNRGTYQPQLYKMFEYGIDLTNPKAASMLLDAIDARHAAIAAEFGLPHTPIPEDIRHFVIGEYTRGGTSGASRDAAHRFMKRKELTPEMRELLAPLADPGYVHAKAIQQIQLAHNSLKMRRWAASQTDFVSKTITDPATGAVRLETLPEFLQRTGFREYDVSQHFAGEYGSRAGALKGRYVHMDFASFLAANDIIPHLHGPDAIDAVKGSVRTWQALSKVVLNPASQSRQVYQNAYAVYEVSGITHAPEDLVASLHDFRHAKGDYLEARNAGLFSAGHDPSLWSRMKDIEEVPEFYYGGMENPLLKLARTSDWMGKVIDKGLQGVDLAGRAFSGTDDVAKLALYKHFRRQGDAPAQAAMKAQDNLYIGAKNTGYEKFQGGQSWRSTRFDRGLGMGKTLGFSNAAMLEIAGGFSMTPFFGAVRHVFQQAYRSALGVSAGSWMPLTDPARLARTGMYWATMYGMAEAGRYLNGMTREEERNQRADYRSPMLPSYPMLPPLMTQLISGDGTHAWMDFSAYTPLGTVTQGGWDVESGKTSSLVDNIVSAFVPMPITGGLAATGFTKMRGQGAVNALNPVMKPILELMFNMDGYSGQRIIPKHLRLPDKFESLADAKKAAEVLAEQGRASWSHLYRAYMPAFLPNPSGLLQAIHAQPVKPEAKEWLKAITFEALQGIATDSGHQASKLVSGIVNSYEYWWNEHGGTLAAAARIVDYRERKQYLGKALADLTGISIESRDHNEIPGKRYRAKEFHARDIIKEHIDRASTATGQRKQQILADGARDAAAVRRGQPTLRDYEMWGDTVNQVFFEATHLWRDAPKAKMKRQDYY